MYRTATFVLTLVAVLFAPPLATATSFAVLLSGPAEPDDPPHRFQNPLYEDRGGKGTNPLFEASALLVGPHGVWPGTPAEMKVTLGEAPPQGIPPAPAGAFLFDITLTDLASGDSIHQLSSPVDLCIEIVASPGQQYDLGYFDEESGQWRVEARLERKGNDKYCGTTDHFSTFYVAAVPEPSSVVLALLAVTIILLGRRPLMRR